HIYGDAVLKTIADTINATIRGSDLLFRYGGEEFVVLTSQTVSDGAYLLAERIRKNIENITQINSITTHTTLSLGVATLLDGESAQQFFERADAALYQAKNNGRNKTEIAEHLPGQDK
ncbi:MAG TPA: GGDEF domain-containing protein, partial [Thiotrichales bacterium]|nr:GGDEF domain-containing protein [Thiotrichales bacterium]